MLVSDLTGNALQIRFKPISYHIHSTGMLGSAHLAGEAPAKCAGKGLISWHIQLAGENFDLFAYNSTTNGPADKEDTGRITY